MSQEFESDFYNKPHNLNNEFDPEIYTRPYLLTKTYHRDPYPAILPSNPANCQEGKNILITGAGSGIGAAAALVWARASAAGIVIAGRRLDKLEEVALKIKEVAADPQIKVLAIKTDVRIDSEVKNLFQKAVGVFGKVPDVLLLSAGILEGPQLFHEMPADEWQNVMEINTRGVYSSIYHHINSQTDPSKPTGTIVTMSSTLIPVLNPQSPAYAITKLALQRLVELIDVTYPTLRIFSVSPGLVPTEPFPKPVLPFALDHHDLTGMLSLYLSQSRADYLKGGWINANWDIEELEQFKDEIKRNNLLKISWLPVLPIGGGKGLPNR